MTKLRIAPGSDQISNALRAKSVSGTHPDGCEIPRAVRGEFLGQYLFDWKVDAVRQLSGSDRTGVGL